MSNTTIKVKAEQEKNTRLDKFLANSLPDFTRSKIQDMIKAGLVVLNKEIIYDVKYKVKSEDVFLVTTPEPKPIYLIPKDINLDIVYEDEHLIVVNKPAGLTTHPGAGNDTDTLVNGLIAHYKNNLSSIGGISRPGIVHRLDKNTSGLLVVAKNDTVHAKLSKLLAERKIKRVYQALVWGIPLKMQDTINTHIARKKEDRKKMVVVDEEDGKNAVTHYKTLKVFLAGRISLVECSLETGRTHQIRVHMLHIGHPIVGDQEYNIPQKKKKFSLPVEISHIKRQMLHAKKLGFIHPITRKKLDFEIELPNDMQELIGLISQ